MGHQFNVAVFDVDGTILDTSEGIIAAVKYTIEKYGLEVPDTEKMKTFIGPPIQDSFSRFFGLPQKAADEMAAVFRNRYKDVELLRAVPYDGIYELFARLVDNGIAPAIATYKRQDYATEILKAFKFDRFTDIMCGSDFAGRLKKKDIIRNALSEAGLMDLSKAVMIGDSNNDAAGANEIGINFIGVTYGFGFNSKEDVYEFKNVGAADTVGELGNLLLG